MLLNTLSLLKSVKLSSFSSRCACTKVYVAGVFNAVDNCSALFCIEERVDLNTAVSLSLQAVDLVSLGMKG